MPSSGAIKAGKAFVELFADDSKLVRGLQRAQKKLVNFGKFTTGLGKKLLGGAAALAAPFVAATAVFSGFSDQMLKVRAVTKATDDEFNTLNETAKKLGRTTSFTAGEVAAGMVELGRAGFDPTQIDNAIASMLSLSRATDTELAQAVEIAGGVLRGFDLEVSQMARVVDVLTETANSSAQTLPDLGEAIKVLAPIAASAGHSVEDTATAIGLLANNSIKGSLAGNSLARAYKNMATDKVQKMLRDMGVQVDDGAGGMRNLGSIMADLGDKTKSLGSLEKLNIFEKIFGRGQAAALKLAGAGAKFDDLNEAIKNSGGAADKAAAVMDSGIGGSLRRLWSSVEGIAISIGETLAPTISRWAESLSSVAGWITQVATKNKAFLITAVKTVAVMAAVGTGLILAGTAVIFFGAVLGTLGTALSGILSVAGAILGAITSPIFLLVAVIGGAAALIWSEWESLSALFAGLWSGIVSTASATWDSLKSIVRGVLNAVQGIVLGAASALSGAFVAVVDGIKSAWAGLAGLFSGVVGGILSGLIGFFSGFVHLMADMFADLVSLIARVFFALVPFVEGVFSGLVSAVSGIVSGLVGFFVSAVKGIGLLFVAVKDVAIGVWNSITSIIKSVTLAATSFFVSAWKTVSNWFVQTLAAVGSFFGSMWNSLIGGLAGAWSSFAGFFGSSVEGITKKAGSDFGSFGDTAVSAWQGIKDAVSAGDLSLAFKIVTLALKSEWIRAVGFMKSKWNAFTGFFSAVWTNAVFGAAKIMTNAWSGLQKFWFSLTDVLMDGWSTFTGFIQKTWNSTVGFLKKAWNGLKKMVTGKDGGPTADDVDKETDRQNRQVDDKRNKIIMEREQERKKSIGEVEERRKGTIQNLTDEVDRREEARRASDEKDVEENNQKLIAAQAELAEAIKAAGLKRDAKEAKEVEKGKGKLDADGKPKLSPVEMIKKIQLEGLGMKAGEKSSIEGTTTGFDRFAGLGKRSEADDRAKEIDALQKIEKNTKKTSRMGERTVPLL